VIAPTTVTRAETFLWYQARPELQLGVAHLWKQNALRYLASMRLAPEGAKTLSISVSAGVQGIGTGNPGYALTAEKNFALANGDRLNAYAGVGLRSNESHGHPLWGVRYNWKNGLGVGLQDDGHDRHPFVTYGRGSHFGGVYLIESKSLGIMIGRRW